MQLRAISVSPASPELPPECRGPRTKERWRAAHLGDQTAGILWHCDTRDRFSCLKTRDLWHPTRLTWRVLLNTKVRSVRILLRVMLCFFFICWCTFRTQTVIFYFRSGVRILIAGCLSSPSLILILNLSTSRVTQTCFTQTLILPLHSSKGWFDAASSKFKQF